jgi:hypothetical protein
MKKVFLAGLAVMAAIMSPGAAQAQFRTVILSDHTETTFTVAANDAPTVTELRFPIGLVTLPAEATASGCLLRVVPTSQAPFPRADQDVTVHAGNEQVGQWSAYGKTTEPYAAELKPNPWEPGSGLTVTLQSASAHSEWDYYGGAAEIVANRPRLIVTYDSPFGPTPVHSGQVSFSPASWPLPDGETPRTNPVSYQGALYLIAGSSDGQRLYRMAGSDKLSNWNLPFRIARNSFAFVTAWGRLKIITEDKIGSCDLDKLGPPGTKADCVVTPDTTKIVIAAGETPVMGPDGSLYFRNVKADGRIVAYNPSLQEIWRTGLKFTTVSPISLSENGHHAYALANIPVQRESASTEIALLRIDTATGTTVTEEVKYEDTQGKSVAPALRELLQPVVASRENVDYVFVSGNTFDTGIFQLVAFEPSVQTFKRLDLPPPKVLWTRLGTVAQHELGVADRFSLFVFGDGSLDLYPFYPPDSAMEEAALSSGRAGVLLADGAVPLQLFDTNNLVRKMTALAQERDEAKDESKSSLGEQKRLEQQLDEARKELEVQEQLEQELDNARKTLEKQKQELAGLNERILRARAREVMWGLVIAGVAIGACSLLVYWILRLRKANSNGTAVVPGCGNNRNGS